MLIRISVLLLLFQYIISGPDCTTASESLKQWLDIQNFYDPNCQTVSTCPSLLTIRPQYLDPRIKGTFAEHTLMNRLPAVSARVLQEGEFSPDEVVVSALQALGKEIPDAPLKVPQPVQLNQLEKGIQECINGFNQEWKLWTNSRSAGTWRNALPLISTEIYFYRRLLDCTAYFTPGEQFLKDPYESQKQKSLQEALRSQAFVQTVHAHLQALDKGISQSERDSMLQNLLMASLWANQGDLALDPSNTANTAAATTITCKANPNLLMDESPDAIKHLRDSASKRRHQSPSETLQTCVVDVVLDNSGIELLCDLVLADALLHHGYADKVRLHAKLSPLFVSDAMAKDVRSHLEALRGHEDELLREIAERVEEWMLVGKMEICRHVPA